MARSPHDHLGGRDMVNDRNSASLASRRDRQVQVGLVLTALWLGAGVLYVAVSMGWTAFLRLPLGDLGDFLDGAFAPLAFLGWCSGCFSSSANSP